MLKKLNQTKFKFKLKIQIENICKCLFLRKNLNIENTSNLHYFFFLSCTQLVVAAHTPFVHTPL